MVFRTILVPLQLLIANQIPPKIGGMSRSPSRLLGSLNQRDPKEREIPPMSRIQRAELIPTVILPSRCSVKLVGMALVRGPPFRHHIPELRHEPGAEKGKGDRRPMPCSPTPVCG